MGRGYEQYADGRRFIHTFEPYNEPDWTGWTKHTWGERRVQLYRVLRANKANQGTVAI